MPDHKEELKALQQQEQELDRLRSMVKPERWPRVYDLLKRVRDRIRKLEKADEVDPDKRDAA